jgi:hypothetical protein
MLRARRIPSLSVGASRKMSAADTLPIRKRRTPLTQIMCELVRSLMRVKAWTEYEAESIRNPRPEMFK